MKYTFTVEYDSDTEAYTVLGNSDNVDVVHSGSSYLRILPKDKSFYGTIGSHHDVICYDRRSGIDDPLKCKGQHLQFLIEKVKHD